MRIPVSDIANRISLSAARRHGIARYAIAVLVAGLALVGAAFGAHALTVCPVTLVASDGYALPDDELRSALEDLSSTGEGAADITPIAFKAGDALWSEWGGFSIGSDRSRIASSFPLFVNDGAAVQTLSTDDSLITASFEELDSLAGLIISDGRAYTEAGEAADDELYRFLAVSSNVFVLLEPMHITSEGVDEMLPTGSIVLLAESSISFYRLEDGALHATRLTVLPQAATVAFGADGADSMRYDELLRHLGLLSEKTDNDVSGANDGDLEKDETSGMPSAHPETTLDSSEGDGQTGEWVWVKPEVSATALVPSVYTATTELTINDPAGVISRPVRFEFRKSGELYMRAGFTSSGAVTVQGLEPNATYEVEGFLTYRDKEGREVEESFFTQKVTMGDPSQLDAVQISFAQGSLYPERLQIADLAFAGGSSELLANATGLSFEIDGKSFPVSAQLRSKMLLGEKVTMTTSASFKSNGSYAVGLAATDRFGNVIPLRASSVQMSTCKAAPKARLHIESNDADKLVIGVDFTDDDSSLAGDATLVLRDESGTVIDSKKVEAGSRAYSFGKLGYDRVLTAEVICSYDLADGQGVLEGQSIGSMNFTTISISVLGYAIYATQVSDVTATEATLSVALNTKQMDARLTRLLTHGSVSAAADGASPIFAHEFSSAEMDRLRAGETLTYRMAGLSPMTTYKLSTTAGAQIGSVEHGVYHDVDATNRPSSFKTMRRDAIVEFAKTAVMSDSITFDVRVLDMDAAVNKNVMLEVRDRYGRLMGEQLRFDPVASDAEGGWQERCSFPNLEEDQDYTVNVIAYDYNLGYDNATLQGRVVLYTGVIRTVDGVSGTIRLRGVDDIDGDAGHLNVRLRVDISDLWGELDPRSFFVEVLREDELIDTVETPFSSTTATLDLDPYAIARSKDTYTFRLVVNLHGQRIVLSETSCSAEYALVGISTEDELKTLPKQDPAGHYILLNDIETKAVNITGTATEQQFTGSFDCQGYTLRLLRSNATPEAPTRSALFYRIGVGGVFKNAVIECDGSPTGTVAYFLSGTISNVKVRITSPHATKYMTGFGGIAMYVYGQAIVENFSVNLGGDHLVTTNAGGAAYYSVGTIRNGFVYGGRLVIPSDVPDDGSVTLGSVGGVVGVSSSSTYESIISTVDVVCPSSRFVSKVGLIVGNRGGNVDVHGVLATGDLLNYYENAVGDDAKLGPLFGVNNTNGVTRDAFYTMTPGLSAADGSSRVSALALYDRAWYREYLNVGNAFDLTPVLRECYPHIALPSSMGAQDYVSLPAKPEVHEPTITSISLIDQGDESATVEVSFSNPDHYTIDRIEVAGATCNVVSQAQDTDDPSITRVTARLSVSDSQDHVSGYSIIGIRYVLYPGKTERIEYNTGLYVINAEFWRPLSTLADWISLRDSRQNYRMTTDLDFSGMRDADFKITTFSGKLDGAGHMLSNIELTTTGVLISTLRGGTVENLTVANMNIANKTVYSCGFIGSATYGSVIDGVRVIDSQLAARGQVAALASSLNGVTVRNCSVSGVDLKVLGSLNRYSVLAGCIASSANNNSDISNCYAQDFSIDAAEATASSGVGGLTGMLAGSSTLSQAYAAGSIEASRGLVGGIAGKLNSTSDRISSVWADVDIATSAGEVGGLVGTVPDGAYVSAASLAVGDIYVSSLAVDLVGRTVGSALDIPGAYYYAGQVVSGLTHEYGTPLDAEALAREATYLGVIGMSGFDLGEVSGGMLPKVLGTDGALLPGQADHYLDNDQVKVTDVTAGMVGSQYQVQVSVEHGAGDTVTGADVEWLDLGAVEIGKTDATHTTLLYNDVEPERAYDVYRMSAIHFERGGSAHEQKVDARVYFGRPIYKTIASITDWVEKVDPETYENYRVTGDLDFSGRDTSTGNMGVKVGRLEGSQVNGRNPVISNIDVTVGTAKDCVSFIEEAQTSVSNLTFKNIKMVGDGKSATLACPSIFGTVSGSGDDGGMHNVEFSGVQLEALAYTNGSVSQKVGIISELLGDLSGVDISDVTIKALNANGSTSSGYYGGLVAAALPLSTIADVDASGITITVSGPYAGSVAGHMNGTASGVSVKDVQVSSTYAGVNSYAGGVFGYAASASGVAISGARSQQGQGDDAADVSTTMVTGTGSYVGGVAGGGYVTAARVNGLIVKGAKNVGGVLGNGGVNRNLTGIDGKGSLSTVDGCIVTGDAENVGGAIGNQNGNGSQFVDVKNTAVSGGSYVGGVYGLSAGGIRYVTAQNVTVASRGDYAGGIAGNGSTFLDSGAANVMVSGGSYVGGIAGSAAYMYRDFVNGASISGASYVGGVSGEVRNRSTNTSFICQATVNATGSYVGGIIGAASPVYTTTLSPVRLESAVFTGSVTGSSDVGGIIGHLSGSTTGNMTGYLVAGTVTSTNGPAGAVFGSNSMADKDGLNAVNTVLLHSSCMVNGEVVSADDPAKLTGCVPSKVAVVSKADLTTAANASARYTNAPGGNPFGLAFNKTFWSFASLASGKFPQICMRYDNSSVSEIHTAQALVAVPEDGPAASTALMSLDGAAAGSGLPSLEGAADIDVYASGVNTFNVEFPQAALGSQFEISIATTQDDTQGPTSDSGLAVIGDTASTDAAESDKGGDAPSSGSGSVVSGTVKQRVYSFAWDFTTPLTITLRGSDGARTYTVDPASVARAAAVWGETAYRIAPDGVHGLDDSLVEGSFVNLFDGRALTSDGSVVDIADEAGDGAVASLDEGAVVQSVADPAALASGDGWRTYWSYTEVEGGAQRDMRLYPCDGDVYGVSAELDTVADGYVLDDVEDTHYRTVLMADGTLRDLADPLVYPDGFDNEGIASMTNTSAADVPLVVVRYDSGLMVCFDYTTGEVKFTKQGSGEDLGLLEYAGEFLDGLFGGLSGTDEVSGGDSGYGDALALEESASHGGLVGLDADGMADSGDDESADGGSNGSSAGSSGAGSAGAGAGSDAGGFASGTDYVSVYEPSSGGYVTYAVDGLLNGQADGVTSVNEACGVPVSGGGSVAVTMQAPAQLGAAGIGQAGQVALFSSAVLGILAILLFI